MACVGNKDWELQDIELENEKSETEGGAMSCCGSAAGQKVSELHDMELESEKPETEGGDMDSEEPETKKPKLMNANEVVELEYESGDDDVPSPTVLYCRKSAEDVPDQLFTELAQLSVAKYKKANSLSHCRFVDLVKVTSVPSNGVIFNLTITADLTGIKASTLRHGLIETLESKIWYQGSSAEMKVRSVFVQCVLD